MKLQDLRVTVASHPFKSEADEARTQLREAAEALHEQAAHSLAAGMNYSRQSARVEQLAEHTNDEDVVYARDLFVKEGLIEIDAATETNAAGGDA